MKRKIALLMVCSMAAVTILGGCGTDETVDNTYSSAESEDEEVTAEELLSASDYDITDYVTLPDDYMDLSITLSSNYEVTDEEIQEYVEDNILLYYPTYDLTDKTTVEEGDIVNIDYVGTLDGEEFDGGSAENYNLTIGSGTFIDGFEDGLIGQDVGTTVDLNLTFPEDYSNEDLAGQDVVFTVTINGIMEERTLGYDEITDQYVEDNFGYGMTTVDDLLEYVEETLASSNDSDKQSEIQSSVLMKLQERSVINYPEELLDERVNQYFDQIASEAEMYGMDYEEYVIGYSGYSDVQSYESAARASMENYLVQELILEAIVADQQVSISKSEFDSYMDTYVAYYGLESKDELYDYFGEDEAQMMLEYAENIALNDVIDAATIVLPNGTSQSGAQAEEEIEETEEAEETGEDETAEDVEDTEEE